MIRGNPTYLEDGSVIFVIYYSENRDNMTFVTPLTSPIPFPNGEAYDTFLQNLIDKRNDKMAKEIPVPDVFNKAFDEEKGG